MAFAFFSAYSLTVFLVAPAAEQSDSFSDFGVCLLECLLVGILKIVQLLTEDGSSCLVTAQTP